MIMTTTEMISTLQVGQEARLINDRFRITVVRKGSGYFYKDHPHCEPELTHLTLNLGTMDASWELIAPSSPDYVDAGTALKALLHGIDIRATYGAQSVRISQHSHLSDFMKLSPLLQVKDLWDAVKWEIMSEE